MLQSNSLRYEGWALLYLSILFQKDRRFLERPRRNNNIIFREFYSNFFNIFRTYYQKMSVKFVLFFLIDKKVPDSFIRFFKIYPSFFPKCQENFYKKKYKFLIKFIEHGIKIIKNNLLWYLRNFKKKFYLCFLRMSLNVSQNISSRLSNFPTT